MRIVSLSVRVTVRVKVSQQINYFPHTTALTSIGVFKDRRRVLPGMNVQQRGEMKATTYRDASTNGNRRLFASAATLNVNATLPRLSISPACVVGKIPRIFEYPAGRPPRLARLSRSSCRIGRVRLLGLRDR